ncbi:hypothetical protein MyNCGM152_56030 [Achromobacter xylosoxidans]
MGGPGRRAAAGLSGAGQRALHPETPHIGTPAPRGRQIKVCGVIFVTAWRLQYSALGYNSRDFSHLEICMESIEQRVKKIVAEQLGVNEAEIKNESSFLDDLGADSLDMVELVMALEDEFETEIPDEEAEKITTVQQAIDYINSNGKQ